MSIKNKLFQNVQQDVELQKIGQEITATILFIDLQGYTSFAAQHSPNEVMFVLKDYYNFIGCIIKSHKGHILDYFGDGILAIFGLSQDKNHRFHGIRAGIDIVQNFLPFAKRTTKIAGHPFKIRIGAHCGRVIIGSLGYEGMEKFAAVGDAVNVAHRIEEANRELLTTFLVSEELYTKTHEKFVFGRYYHIPIKGKSGAKKVYEVIS
ncbi:MAG: adenylate/guanylate cyclase domain-containing protein [Cyclobacteriaceae bacterium]|nr:adenylate/guanylate cyclase domain-containing protein [Cyclobacteriaceae bacterium]